MQQIPVSFLTGSRVGMTLAIVAGLVALALLASQLQQQQQAAKK